MERQGATGQPEEVRNVSGVSVVIPVYNSGRYLRPCLDSLLDQDIAPSLLEIVAVDDGSTDGSGAVLDEYAALHPQIRVIHQENSGWPGRPRNVGVDASHGEFVFFMDADDYAGREAFRRLYEFASNHDCDMVVPKLVGTDGRWMHKRPWERTQVDADLKLAFLTLSPQKLFRRTFLDRHGLRFPEGRVRLEDGILVARAYLLASFSMAGRISLVGDYDYYFIRSRDDGGNISTQGAEAQGYCDSLRVIIDTIRELCPDPELARFLALDLYRRKALKPFTPQRFPRWSDERRKEWVTAVSELADSHIPPEFEQDLSFPFNIRAHLARQGDLNSLTDLATRQRQRSLKGRVAGGRAFVDLDTAEGTRTVDVTDDLRLQAEITRVGRGTGSLVLHGRARLADLDGLDTEQLPRSIVLREQASGAERLLDVRSRGLASHGWHVFEATLRGRALSAEPGGPTESRDGTEIWALLLRCDLAGTVLEGRLAATGKLRKEPHLSVSLPIRGSRHETHPYVTGYGNVSLRVDKLDISPGRRRARSAHLVLDVVRRRVRRRARRRSSRNARGDKAPTGLPTPARVMDQPEAAAIRIRAMRSC